MDFDSLNRLYKYAILLNALVHVHLLMINYLYFSQIDLQVVSY